MLDDLVKLALIGTGRGAGNLPAAEGSVADALAKLPPAANAESALLRAAVMTAGYLACGRVPAETAAAPAPAPVDTKPACSARAGDILGQLLAMTQTPAKVHLIDEWLHYAAVAGKRPPHALLPDLLDFGESRRAARDRINAVLGERGRWLMAQNLKWKFGVDELQDPQQAWSTGTPPQRLAALRRVRSEDPAGARAMIQSTWKEDGADERSAFVAALADRLSPGDEPFLEAALDDRSKQVRAAAVDLLSRLPSSAYIARMTARAETLLVLNGKKIEVTLPQSFDPQWARDGVEEKPPQRMGQKQYWLQQIVAAVPPAHWSLGWKLDPAQCIAAADADHVELLIDAWSRAAERAKDVPWMVALLRAVSFHRRGEVDLFAALPGAERAALFEEAMTGTSLDIPRVNHLLSLFHAELSAPMAAALTHRIDRHAAASSAQYDYHLTYLLPEAALRVPPGFLAELAARWKGLYWETNAKTVENFFQTLQLRRDIQRELAT